MMHTCPDCGQACTCNGDFEDLMWDDDSPQAVHCNHVLLERCNDDAEDEFLFGPTLAAEETSHG